MTTELTVQKQGDNAVLEKVVLEGDLSALTPADRVKYYARVCESMGLNPFTRPFEYIKLNGKLTLYARRDATDQIRNLNGVSIEITNRETIDGVYVVTARAKIGERLDESTGAVDVSKLAGEFKANAMMKAETKAKRRVTLSIVGLGWLDETEIADINKKDIEVMVVDDKTGEIKHSPDAPQSIQSTPKPPEATKTPPTTKVTQAEVKKALDTMTTPVPTPTIKEITDILKKLIAGKLPGWEKETVMLTLATDYGGKGTNVTEMLKSLTPENWVKYANKIKEYEAKLLKSTEAF